MDRQKLDIFLVCQPGFEAIAAQEAREQGLSQARAAVGGVEAQGFWSHVWKANLRLRCTTRVLVRIESFHAVHLAQLDKRARRIDWNAWLPKGAPIRVEAVSRGSKIYHEAAAAQRVALAMKETAGLHLSQQDEAAITVKLRIEKDLCTISLDTSGAALHVRGHRVAVGKAPLRETLAANFLRACGYKNDRPVLDMMCGSGTFPMEAAAMARGLMPGRDRSFSFEQLPSFEADAFAALKASAPQDTGLRFYGSDRDAGAIENCRLNAERAGVADICDFQHASLMDAVRPKGGEGIVMLNPPYGERIGDKRALLGLHAALGKKLKADFQGWTVGLITSDANLAHTTGLSWGSVSAKVSNGGIDVRLYQTSL